VQVAAPSMRGAAQIVAGNTNWSTVIQGVTPEYLEAREWPVVSGRGFEPQDVSGAGGKVDLPSMLADLAQRGINELHVEAGHKLNASLLRENLVDELLIYLAPKLLGIGREMAAFGPLQTLAEALPFEYWQVDRVGADLRILARPPGRATFLDDNR